MLPTFPDEVFEEFSAPAYIQRGSGRAIPMLIARAGLDAPALNASIDRLIAAALAGNMDIDVMNHSTGHHGFDILDDNARSREIIHTTLEFMKTHVVP